ncbi:hypothetical protein [Yersinia phage vB_Yru_GN1]|uniref:Uncharacterized protein n=1 Tax=Yersinia phage vB_Yru_GN1 TaxID=3074381 RepID=A0AA86IWW3_9CAUD|nr:hypothetical protein [Yersinia phage vB_Yru_GN1]
MKLDGITPISYGRNNLKFIDPITGVILSNSSRAKNNSNKYYHSLGITWKDVILKINNISYNELPNCEVCGNKCSIKGTIVDPIIDGTCSSKCSIIRRNRSINNNLSPEKLKEKIHKIHYGMSKESRSLRNKKINRSALINGNHSFQSHGKIKLVLNDKTIYFKSKIERSIYLKYKRLLTKFYKRELRFKIPYMDDKYYHPDYSINSDIINKFNLPDYIEIKNGNLFNESWYGDNAKLINYLKFKVIIDNNKSLLIIDNKNKYLITNIIELNKLFNVEE